MGDLDGVRLTVDQRRRQRGRRWLDVAQAVVMILLAIAVFALARSNDDLQRQLNRTDQRATQERADLAMLLEGVRVELDEANRGLAARDAEIRRLTTLLLAAGEDPGTPVPGSRPPDRGGATAAVRSSPTPGPTSGPPASNPPAAASPTPSPAPSPSPSCRVQVVERCVVQVSEDTTPAPSLLWSLVILVVAAAPWALIAVHRRRHHR
jgi:hypothetical protein